MICYFAKLEYILQKVDRVICQTFFMSTKIMGNHSKLNIVSLEHQGSTLCLFDYYQYMEPQTKVNPLFIDAHTPLYPPRCHLSGLIQWVHNNWHQTQKLRLAYKLVDR